MKVRQSQVDQEVVARVSRRAILAGAVLLGLSALPGCGGSQSQEPTEEVTIRVTHGGQPVQEGSVQLVDPQTGKGAFGDLDETGTVNLAAVPLGTYTVVVMPPAPADPDPTKPAPPPKDYLDIPEVVRTQATSPFKAEVTEDATEFSFDLKQ